MSKGTITYTDRDGGAPVVTWHGREFISTVPVPVDDDDDALIEAAESNRFFAYKPNAKVPSGDSAETRGRKAAESGAERSIPAPYQGKPEGDAWLFGYDEYVRQTPVETGDGPPPEDHEALAQAKTSGGAGVIGVSQTNAIGDEAASRPTGQYPKAARKSR